MAVAGTAVSPGLKIQERRWCYQNPMRIANLKEKPPIRSCSGGEIQLLLERTPVQGQVA